mmetsp:Transcript_88059/g.152553  ORF Transcript_88059/g.152553 Transcript_88059/m.152553 type:complete len:231 (+) Transcript_88059:91-783(+)
MARCMLPALLLVSQVVVATCQRTEPDASFFEDVDLPAPALKGAAGTMRHAVNEERRITLGGDRATISAESLGAGAKRPMNALSASLLAAAAQRSPALTRAGVKAHEEMGLVKPLQKEPVKDKSELLSDDEVALERFLAGANTPRQIQARRQNPPIMDKNKPPDAWGWLSLASAGARAAFRSAMPQWQAASASEDSPAKAIHSSPGRKLPNGEVDRSSISSPGAIQFADDE